MTIPTSTPLSSRCRSLRRAVSGAATAIVAPMLVLCAQSGSPKPASPAFILLTGTVTDSIHRTPLVRATVSIEGTDRSAVTNADGEYRIDSIPPGAHRVIVMHPLLDTIGRSIVTQAIPFAAGEALNADLSTPTGDSLAAALCNPAQRNQGPAVMLGFVKDPDTGAPAVGATVSLVFYATDVVGRKMLRVPTAKTDSAGRYKICGLPRDMSGKVQVFRNGVSG